MDHQNNDNFNMDTFEGNAEQNLADINDRLVAFGQMQDFDFMENETGFQTPVAPEGGYHFEQEFDVTPNYSEPYYNDTGYTYDNFPTLNQSFEPTNAEQSNFQTLPSPRTRLSVDTAVPQIQQGEYQNQILNEFDSPATPLQVIDQYHSPQGFEPDLQQLLVDELQNQNGHGGRFSRFGGGRNNPRPKALTSTGKESKNKRPENIASLNPSKFYEPLPGGQPRSWGPTNPLTNQPLFQYTKYGELAVGQEFTTEQLVDFLFQNPNHGMQQFPQDVTAYRENSGLTIWIQNPPADSSKRYPEKGSDKCRWAECPVKDHTIHKGFYRVAFDERSRYWADRNVFLDPYHNAGYMHLFCFEKMVDFPSVSKLLNVRPDTRQFREGKNKMAITRDHKAMEAICNDFIRDSRSWPGGERSADSQDWYPATLCSALTEFQIAHYPNRVLNLFTARGGNNISIHRGNCDVYAANEVVKERRPMKPRAPDAKKPGRKRKVREPSPEDANPANEEFVPDTNILERIDSLPSKRPAKRPRRSSQSPDGLSPTYSESF
ncbi:hypothetical protein HYALB_00003849 [Hymenoscyphus albidus]|uniref:Uncharacterized protein n=1 Tax=Hymenoscyphus albidus TaxID=595503 RepID=A0A9N9LZ42_9HELO|nr:hypothetical protein HYALB_00003849 [Hymenoscyphus albidus]